MKAILVVDVYCPNGCGCVMHKTEDGRCVCQSPNCKGHGVLFHQPTIELRQDWLAACSPKPSEVKP